MAWQLRKRENETAKREGLDKLGIKEETKLKKKRREKAPTHRHHGHNRAHLKTAHFVP